MLILRRRRHHLLNVAATRFVDIVPISPPMVVHASSSSSSSGDESATAKTEAAASDHDHQKYWTPPPGMARVPWYRRKRHLQHWPAEEKKWGRHGDTWDGHRDEHMVTADKTADGARLNDYYKVQQIVNWLPTIKEKIDFVNPYERDWSRAERRWHGRWMQPLLMPRKAWAIPPTPAYFDPLNFYKFVTKCRVLGGQEARQALDDYYAGLSFPSAKLEKRVAETLAFHLEESAKIRDSSNAESLAENVVDSDELEQRRAKFLRSLVEDAHLVLAHGNQKLLNHRISYNPRCESFWTRAGFASLYQSQPIWETKKEEEEAKDEEAPPPMPPKNKPRLAGDDRRRLGEFSFTMRDKFACQVRTTSPMKNLFNWTPDSPDNRLFEPLFTASDFDGSDEDKFTVLSPGNYNLHLDRDILWQCPGYEYDSGETHQFGRLAVKDIGPIFERMAEYWRPDSPQEREEMLDQCVKAAAIASLFNWLNGQAHCLGHTQYTELAAPLTSQLILSDGQQNFWFAVAQLNTLAINIEVEGFNNRRTNCCYVDGPYRLYESWERGKDGNAQFQHKSSASLSDLSGVPQNWAAKRGLRPGLNPALLQRLLQACVV